MKYIATGLIPADPSGAVTSSAPSKNNNNELTVKVDYNITDKDKLSATVGGFRNPQLQPFGQSNLYGSTVSGFSNINQVNTYFGNIAYTHAFSPSVLNDFRATVQRHYSLANKTNVNLPTPAQLGFGITPDLPNGPPLMSFDNNLAFGTDQAGPAYESGNTYAFSDAFTWVRGHHTWKFGGGFSIYQNNTLYDFFGDGSFSFVGPYADGGIGSGNSLADFLLGIPNNLFEGPNARNNIRSKASYGFAQDEWRVRKNLTLTLGLRYEYSTPKLDTQGRSFNIIPGAQSTRFPNAPLGIVFPGDPGAPRGVNFPDKDNFAPRIGFAWDPRGDGKTSFRGGFGIFYDVLKGEDNLQFNGAPPFYSENGPFYPCLPSANDAACTNPPILDGATGGAGYYSQPWTSGGFAASPFPSTPPNPNVDFVASGFLPLNLNGGIYFVDPHLHTPYSYQYNLSMQHELAPNLMLELSYVGSDSKGLTSLVDINPFILGTENRTLNLNQPNANINDYCASFFSAADCPFATSLAFRNAVFASYNSLEASLTKQPTTTRFFGTTYFTLGYTYGHSLDDASGFRNRDSQVPFYNPRQFHSSSDFDLTQRFTFSGGWDLPFDKAWADGPKRLVKGWSLYPILSWRTGFPLSVNAAYSFDPSLPGPSGAGDGPLANATFAPGVTSLPMLNPHSITSLNGTTGNFYFDPSAFLCSGGPCVPTSGYGLPRNFFRGPGRFNLDIALAKTTAITERMNLELRLEAFNVFNHPEFASPDTTIGSQTFGEVTSTDLGSGLNTLHTERILQIAARVTF